MATNSPGTGKQVISTSVTDGLATYIDTRAQRLGKSKAWALSRVIAFWVRSGAPPLSKADAALPKLPPAIEDADSEYISEKTFSYLSDYEEPVGMVREDRPGENIASLMRDMEIQKAKIALLAEQLASYRSASSDDKSDEEIYAIADLTSHLEKEYKLTRADAYAKAVEILRTKPADKKSAEYVKKKVSKGILKKNSAGMPLISLEDDDPEAAKETAETHRTSKHKK